MRRGQAAVELTEEEFLEELQPLAIRLTKDLKDAAGHLGDDRARYLVDLYYQLQEFRKASKNQVRSATNEPNALLTFVFDTMQRLEKVIRGAMDIYTDQDVLSRWSKAQFGVGPCIAGGFRAHIDVRKAKTAGAIFRFAGLDPTVKWEKGRKRPWNADLKRICFLAGRSFWYFHNRDKCFYGKLIAERKDYEVARNERGDCKADAELTLATKKIRDPATRAIYESGKLPPGRVHQRALRWGVKLLLSHYFEVGRESLGLPIVKPWVIEHGGHVHQIKPPLWENGKIVGAK